MFPRLCVLLAAAAVLLAAGASVSQYPFPEGKVPKELRKGPRPPPSEEFCWFVP